MDERIQVVLEAKDLMSGEVRRVTGAVTGMDQASGRLKLTTVALGTALGSLATRAIGEAVEAIGDLASKSVEFQTAMLNVNSIAKVGTDDFNDMKQAVLDLSTELPQSAKTLADGLYDISSSGFAGKQGIDVLNAAAKAASAGLTDTSVSAAGLTAILNSYGYGADQASRVSDIMFRTVDRGVISFEELAGEIGKTTALSAPLGVDLEEVAAAIALMTRKGIDGANATTQLNAIMQTLLKPSKEAAELANELGLGWNAQALEAKGLSGVLADLMDKTHGNQEQMATLLGDARSIRGAFVLAADGGAGLTAEIEQMRDATGATDTALSYQKQGLAYNVGILGNQVDAAAIKIGDKLIPTITDMVQSASEWLDENEDLIESVGDTLVVALEGLATAIGGVITVSGGLIGFLADAPPLVIGLSTALAVALVPAIWSVVTAVGGLMIAALPVTGPLLAITAVVGGLAAAGNVAIDAVNGIALSMGDMGDSTQALADRTGVSVDEIRNYIHHMMVDTDASFEDALHSAEFHFGAIVKTADSSFKAYDETTYQHMLAAKGHVVGEAQATATGVQGAIEDGTPGVGDAADAMADEIAQAAEDARKAAVESIKDLMDATVALFEDTDDLEQAVADFHDIINNPWPDTKRRAAIEAQLASDEIAQGLRSDDSRVRQETINFVNELLTQYGTMAPGALAKGELVNPALGSALRGNVRLALDAAQDVADRTGSELDFKKWAADAGLGGMVSMAAAIEKEDYRAFLKAQAAAKLAKSGLKIDGTTWGKHLAQTYANGINADAWRVNQAAIDLAKLASRPIAMSAPPDIGPISKIREWGPHFVQTYAAGILGESRLAGEAGLAVATEAARAMAEGPAGGPGFDVVGPAIAVGGIPVGGIGRSRFDGGAEPPPAPVVIQLQVDGRTLAEIVDRHLYYGQPASSAVLPRR